MAMTEASVQEQRGAGLTELTPEEFESFSLSNRAYTERFGFPFILAVRGHTKQSIYESLILRLGNTPEEELETALLEIGKITYYRLDALVEQETTPDGQQTEGDGCA
jgi:OHCU decarboxylase